MPITFRLRRDHLRFRHPSETNFIAISGSMEIGGVSWDIFGNQSSRFRWTIAAVNTTPVMGWADTVEDAKAALERAWFDWVARHGLKDDPEAAPAPPVKDRG